MSSKSAPASDPAGTPAAVLARARADKKAEQDYQARVVADALEWAALHAVPAEEVDETLIATWRGTPIPLAGEGAPFVEEFCVPELATALGLSQDAGRALLAQSLELGHRLTGLYERVENGDAPAWKARKVADLTLGLTAEAAAWVDRRVADFVGSMSMAAIERLVEEAIARFMPEEAEQRRRKAADGRRFDIHHGQVSFEGTSRVEGELDLADALDLDAAVAAGAQALGDLGCEEDLNVRRSKAAGELARRQLAFGFPTIEETGTDAAGAAGTDAAGADADAGAGVDAGSGSGTEGAATAAAGGNDSGSGAGQAGERQSGAPSGQPATPIKPGRQVMLYIHLHESAIRGTSSTGDVARVENRGPHLVTADTIRDWLDTEGTKVTVRPVIDLNDETAVDAYEVPDRLREAVILRDRTCYFPYCTTPARLCDIDHVVPFDQGGTTSASNLAPGCRRDHRAKTHGGWRVRVIRPGTYEWTSPKGLRYLVWPGGTIDLNPDPPSARPGQPDEPDESGGPGEPGGRDGPDEPGGPEGLSPTGTDPP